MYNHYPILDPNTAPNTSPTLDLVRLVLLTVLNCRMDNFLALFGLVCSSFVTISKGGHWRCPTSPLGLDSMKFVNEGNEFTAKFFGLDLQLLFYGLLSKK